MVLLWFEKWKFLEETNLLFKRSLETPSKTNLKILIISR